MKLLVLALFFVLLAGGLVLLRTSIRLMGSRACPSCGATVAKRADDCPRCGQPIASA